MPHACAAQDRLACRAAFHIARSLEPTYGPSAGDEGESALARLGGALGGLGDLERGLTRALHKTASPAELVTTLRALASVGPALGLQASP